MTILYGAIQGVAAIKAEALAVHNAKVPKHHLRNGGLYLHWSASKLTPHLREAWSGTIEQARACRRTFGAAAGCKAIPVNLVPSLSGEEA